MVLIVEMTSEVKACMFSSDEEIVLVRRPSKMAKSFFLTRGVGEHQVVGDAVDSAGDGVGVLWWRVSLAARTVAREYEDVFTYCWVVV